MADTSCSKQVASLLSTRLQCQLACRECDSKWICACGTNARRLRQFASLICLALQSNDAGGVEGQVASANWQLASGQWQVASDRRSVASADCLATVSRNCSHKEKFTEEFPFCFHLELWLELSLPHTLQREHRERQQRQQQLVLRHCRHVMSLQLGETCANIV